MTTADRETGLPIVGEAPGKQIPIDPKLLPDLRDADVKVSETRLIGQQIGYQLVLLLGSAATIGPTAAINEKNYRDLVGKIAALHGVNVAVIKDIDIEKGVIILK